MGQASGVHSAAGAGALGDPSSILPEFLLGHQGATRGGASALSGLRAEPPSYTPSVFPFGLSSVPQAQVDFLIDAIRRDPPAFLQSLDERARSRDISMLPSECFRAVLTSSVRGEPEIQKKTCRRDSQCLSAVKDNLRPLVRRQDQRETGNGNFRQTQRLEQAILERCLIEEVKEAGDAVLLAVGIWEKGESEYSKYARWFGDSVSCYLEEMLDDEKSFRSGISDAVIQGAIPQIPEGRFCGSTSLSMLKHSDAAFFCGLPVCVSASSDGQASDFRPS
uniref:Uncharacterized protein n=1 Tax=Chromera velia CCMP2878 TaxID=1169474 RepID=A0A0G4IAW5_9ALVE|eukprot:Cvel_12586.t1-p1 / transcript=Cvel_12586.t1 / gene=Cvel_12586 / organism=Chromera_velia_CCMP2878 / gene_product=hypothetical protein / transcript_product=hypothetical protein / location=Cvel_scaffold829:21320-23046(+) / protein_length=277 / sequence_SO=supercontig / SO=protein_coding / is_pseudo=false